MLTAHRQNHGIKVLPRRGPPQRFQRTLQTWFVPRKSTVQKQHWQVTTRTRVDDAHDVTQTGSRNAASSNSTHLVRTGQLTPRSVESILCHQYWPGNSPFNAFARPVKHTTLLSLGMQSTPPSRLRRRQVRTSSQDLPGRLESRGGAHSSIVASTDPLLAAGSLVLPYSWSA